MKWLAWALWALAVGALAFTMAYGAPQTTDEPEHIPVLVAFGVFLLAFATVGALVASARPRNPIGWIMCGAAIAYALGGIGAAFAAAEEGPLLLTEWLGSWAWGLAFAVAGTFLLLLFPDGSLPSARWRPVAWGSGAATLAFVLGQAFQPELAGRDGPVDNPLGAGGAAGAIFDVLQQALAFVVLAILASVASLVVRYRRAGEEERLQLKWLTYAGGLVALALAGALLIAAFAEPSDAKADLQYAILTAALAGVPLAIGVAVFKYRLYEIDLIINRTLVYVPLVGIIGGLAAATIPVAQRIFGAESDVGVVLTVLVVAAFVTPVRKRIEATVDRRFKPVPSSGTGPLVNPALEARIRAVAEEAVREALERRGISE
ncbi:MAG: hypothetical protein ICV67_04580 [Thermoleophilia bacterium]|nr:hypothetical protein [Thermoleophilia bacterium]